jgi:hypothetical protein
MYAATGPDGKRQHTVAEIAEAVNGTPSGLFHQYREVPERTGQIAPKVPRHLTGSGDFCVVPLLTVATAASGSGGNRVTVRA